MADNTSPNGGGGVIGLLIGALAALRVIVFLFVGKKTVESDNDLPPVHMSQPRQ
jgi:hypothetical protein